MAIPRDATLGEFIYSRIDNDDYLQEIYETILFNYSMNLLHQSHRNKAINKDHALRFADILSKSAGHKNSEKHKTWAQEIIALLNSLYPNDAKIKAYASSVLSSIGNYRGLQLIKSRYKNASLLEELYINFDMDYLSIPYQEDKYFFHSQKEIYEKLEEKTFSYSGPTSMGKSLLMRMFIKDKILSGFKGNFAILVPTKALITEISSSIMHDDLRDELAKNNYKIVTSANSIFLKQEGLNYIMVVTPERMLYLLMSYPNISIDYLFIDEAHKITEGDGRSAFYYKVTDMLVQRERKPHVILASPNIPNPYVFFKALPFEQQENAKYVYTSFTPVSQMKYIVDLVKNEFLIYNEKSNKKDPFINIESLYEFANYYDVIVRLISNDTTKSNIIYCDGRQKTVELALKYASTLSPLDNKELDELARCIKDEIHNSYFLADLIKKGIAYHVGYLPLHIRTSIEELYRAGLIKTLFCTSTLIEGVNLPADNLFIISFTRGGKTMTSVEFKNLLGRVGRIKYNLYGNVFIIRHGKQSELTIKNLLKKEVEDQKISLETSLKPLHKEHIVRCLIDGSSEFKTLPNQDEHSYNLMRKIGLILLRDILKDRHSVIRDEFNSFLDDHKIKIIKSHFDKRTEDNSNPDDDINISLDQTQNLVLAIKNGLKYPELVNNKVDYNDLVSFLKKLSVIFKWDIYEPKTLGYKNKIEYYANILVRWINGDGLSQIIKNTLEYNRIHFNSIKINNNWEMYNDSPFHKNIVIGNTLSIVENIILFSIANYFLKFSTEYKRLVTNGATFKNDWYEYVEFGSTNELTIFFQRNGLTRETSDFIRKYKHKYVHKSNNVYNLKKSLLQCGNKEVEKELREVIFNIPELFIE